MAKTGGNSGQRQRSCPRRTGLDAPGFSHSQLVNFLQRLEALLLGALAANTQTGTATDELANGPDRTWTRMEQLLRGTLPLMRTVLEGDFKDLLRVEPDA